MEKWVLATHHGKKVYIPRMEKQGKKSRKTSSKANWKECWNENIHRLSRKTFHIDLPL